jgi:glycosyltransferase involved in cell wall biosynthesis
MNKDFKQITVSHFQRKTIGKVFSLESIGSFVREESDSIFLFKKKINYFYSLGIFRRLLDAILALFRQGDVNHIMGDIHYLGILLNSKKTVLTIADCVSLNRLNGYKKYIIWFFWYFLPVKRAAKIVVISDFIKSELLTYVSCDPNKIKVIYVPLLCRVQKNKFNQSSDKLNFLHIGSTDNKNLSRHTAAIRGIPATLNFVGEPSKSDLKLLKENCHDYTVVSNLSNEDLIKLYDQCDLLLFASTYEGFGMPIIEAQSRGLPVITSNLCSMPEVAGYGACIVDPYNIDEIRSAINKILHNRESN